MSAGAWTSQDRTVVTDDGTSLRTRIDGHRSAPTLLLCNSLGTDLSLWDPQLATWTETHRVLRFDQRGHGASGTATPPYTLDGLGSDALAVLDAHDVGTADVCGISLGGMVALWLASHVPDRIRSVVAADTGARVGTEEAWRERAELVRGQGMSAVHDAVLARFFSPAFLASSPPEVDRLGRLLLDADPEGYAGACEALATADLTPHLGRVRAPVLVVVGSEDVATPPDDASALRDALADAELIELPGAGHLANLERPDLFAEVVARHLDSTAQDGGPE